MVYWFFEVLSLKKWTLAESNINTSPFPYTCIMHTQYTPQTRLQITPSFPPFWRCRPSLFPRQERGCQKHMLSWPHGRPTKVFKDSNGHEMENINDLGSRPIHKDTEFFAIETRETKNGLQTYSSILLCVRDLVRCSFKPPPPPTFIIAQTSWVRMK